jgi:PTS system nitrogen regulatory IIA component
MNNEPGFADLVEKGGVFYGIRGTNPREVISGVIDALPPSLFAEKAALLEAVLEREALMSTGIGGGIALPHPRNPMAAGDGQFVTIAFPASAIDWNALDGGPVSTVMLIVSASAKLHLHTLSRINFLCRQESFARLLERRGSRDEIIAAVRRAEEAWR